MMRFTEVRHRLLVVNLAMITLLTHIAAAQVPAGQGPLNRAVGPGSVANSDGFGVGAVRATAAQWDWGEKHMVKTKQVRWNELGLGRVNATRQARGLRRHLESEAVPMGRESVGAKPDRTVTPSGPVDDPVPATVDNSTLKFFPPVRSQGSLNSCAQFSAVYYTLTHMTAMARNWDAKNGGDEFRFSPKWTYNMVNGGQNAGSWHYTAYMIAQKHGLATWSDFPYDADYRSWCMDPDAWLYALCNRTAEAGKITDMNTDSGLTLLKQLLVNGYVLNFATYFSSWQWGTISNDPSTAADDAYAGKNCAYAVSGTSGGHSMTIVGYSDDVWIDLNGNGGVDSGEKGALRIANSWGPGWNEGGFCWLAYSALRTANPANRSECAFWYDEATWVTAREDYVPRLVAEFALRHSKRGQIEMAYGASAPIQVEPAPWSYPERILFYSGGMWSFDGTTTPRDMTFFFDFTDLVPAGGGAWRYYLRLVDSISGDVASVLSYRLLDAVTGEEVSGGICPAYADGPTQEVVLMADYDAGGGSEPPVGEDLLAPSQLVATASRGAVALTWVDNALGESGFTLERAAKSGKNYSPFEVIAVTSADAQGYTDAVSGGAYRYRVQAFSDATGASSPCSNEVSVRVK